MRAIRYHLRNWKNVKNTYGKVLLLAEAWNFTKSNTPSWVFFMFFKLNKWYQITQRFPYESPINFLELWEKKPEQLASVMDEIPTF